MELAEVGSVVARSAFVAPDLPDAHEAGLNVIHDHTVAASLGFSSALVGGVTTFGLMIQDALQALGDAWYERGYADVRWVKPVYSGETMEATTVVSEVVAGGASLSIDLEDRKGEVRVLASCVAPRDQNVAPDPAEFRFVSEWTSLLPKGERPDLAVGNEQIGEPLRPVSLIAGASSFDRGSESLRVGPQWFAGAGIELIRNNFNRPSPNIHVSSRIWTYAPLSPGEPVAVYGGFSGNFQRRGHMYIEEDVQFRDASSAIVARVHNTFIYELRRV